MESFAISDPGRCREENEDAVFSCDAPLGKMDNLYIVADGMGGHQAGGYASAYAIARTTELISEDTGHTTAELLRNVYDIVNIEVYEKGLHNESMTGMGTTMVLCTVSNDGMLTAANVGDSRMYTRHVNGNFVQVTKDHSYVEELVRKGQLERDSEAYMNAKNVITRAIGAGETITADIYQLETDQISQILLCSDGLSNMLSDDKIAEILGRNNSAEEKAHMLVSEANEAGGKDNISVVVVETGNH